MLDTHHQSETGLELFGKALGHHALIGAIRTVGRHHPTSPKDQGALELMRHNGLWR